MFQAGTDMSAVGIAQIGLGLLSGIVLLRPLHVLVHELGHAVAILAFTRVTPTIRMGRGPSRSTVSLGRLRFRIGSEGRLQADCGYESAGVRLRFRVMIAAAGPFFSCAAMLGSVLLAVVAGPLWIQAAALGSTLVHGRIFVSSAWPTRGEHPSDGAQIRELLDRSAA